MIVSDFETGVIPVIKSEVSNRDFENDLVYFFTNLFLVSCVEAHHVLFSLLSSDISPYTKFRNAKGLFNK